MYLIYIYIYSITLNLWISPNWNRWGPKVVWLDWKDWQAENSEITIEKILEDIHDWVPF